MENTNDTLQEKIQAFINGELDETARRALLEQAKTDTRVADELAFSRSLAQVLRYPEWAAANSILGDVIAEEGFPPPSSPATNSGKWWAWLTAAILFLSALTGGYFWADNAGLFASETQRMARASLKPLESVLFFSNNNPTIPDLQSGMTAYDAGKYSEAARLLRIYMDRNPDNAARVYLGVSYLMSGQAAKAIPPLSIATQSQEPPIQETALWYLALAYLETNDLPAAIQTLESIPSDGIYGVQAQELLKIK